MPIIRITSLNNTEIQVFSSLTETQLRKRDMPLFIAESPKVIHVALDAGYMPEALLCEERHITGDASSVIARCPDDMPVYTGSRELLSTLTGYTLTRGVLCAMRRKPLPTTQQVCDHARRIAIIDSVSDTTNIGSIFRSAAALGIDGVLLTPTSCDPFNRRSIRVSMGSVFLVPWTWIEPPLTPRLNAMGVRTAAMALTDRSVNIDDPVLSAEPRLALILGTEGDGLSHDVISEANYVARIPMWHNVDSLNVGAAAAVAFWQLRVRIHTD